MKALLLILPLAGCAAPPVETGEASAPPFRTCLPLPAPLPALRTVEAVRDHASAVERVALDCSERLRRVVAAWPK